MMDRVAKVLHDRTIEAFKKDLPQYDDRGVDVQDLYRKLAKVIIAEMREPTKKMALDGYYREDPCMGHDTTEIWRHMIDSALQETA